MFPKNKQTNKTNKQTPQQTNTPTNKQASKQKNNKQTNKQNTLFPLATNCFDGVSIVVGYDGCHSICYNIILNNVRTILRSHLEPINLCAGGINHIQIFSTFPAY